MVNNSQGKLDPLDPTGKREIGRGWRNQMLLHQCPFVIYNEAPLDYVHGKRFLPLANCSSAKHEGWNK